MSNLFGVAQTFLSTDELFKEHTKAKRTAIDLFKKNPQHLRNKIWNEGLHQLDKVI
jgi:hypothetical protein